MIDLETGIPLTVGGGSNSGSGQVIANIPSLYYWVDFNDRSKQTFNTSAQILTVQPRKGSVNLDTSGGKGPVAVVSNKVSYANFRKASQDHLRLNQDVSISNRSFFFTAKKTSEIPTSGASYVMFSNSSATDNYFGYLQNQTTNSDDVIAGATSIGYNLTKSGSPFDNHMMSDWHVFGYVHAGTSVQTYIDGYALNNNAVTQPSMKINQIARFAAGLSSIPDFALGEMVVLDTSAPDAATVSVVNKYLFDKWVAPAFEATVGTGETYTAVNSALYNDRVRWQGPYEQKIINVRDGTYLENACSLSNGNWLRGQSRSGTIIDGGQPDSATENSIQLISPVDFDGGGRISGMTVIASNNRYGIHMDGGGRTTDGTYIIEDCKIIHRGNPSPNSTWNNVQAIGAGQCRGGTHHIVRNCELVSQTTGFSIHDADDMLAPGSVSVNNVLTSIYGVGVSISYRDLRFRSLWPGDVTSIAAVVRNMPNPIIIGLEREAYAAGTDPTKMSYLPMTYKLDMAQTNAAVPPPDVAYGSNNMYAKSLVLTDATVNRAAPSISGTALSVLFAGAFGGAQQEAGGGGLYGRAYGTFDVSEVTVGISANVMLQSLGKRLGDCSGVNKTLNVSIGSTAVSVVFNQDYTAWTNTSVLSDLNTKLGGTLIASTSSFTNEVYRWVNDRDWETMITNNGVVGFNVGDVLYNDAGTWRLATASDPNLSGVALTRMVPGASGRIKTGGYIHYGCTNWNGGNPSNGSRVVVRSAQAGQVKVSSGGTQIGMGYVYPGVFAFNV